METNGSIETVERGNAPRGRPLDLSKRLAILDAAHSMFVTGSYSATSMDAIAAAAGVSKLTAYNHFGSKAALFSAVIERKCRTMLEAINFEAIQGLDARRALIAVGKGFVRLVTDADAIGAHNIIVQERERAPELGPLFFESAVHNTACKVAGVLEGLNRRGEIKVADPLQSARDILSLWRAQPTMHIELSISPFGTEELDAHVERIVDLFLKAWA